MRILDNFTYYFWDQCLMQSCEKALILRWDLLICQEMCNTMSWRETQAPLPPFNEDTWELHLLCFGINVWCRVVRKLLYWGETFWYVKKFVILRVDKKHKLHCLPPMRILENSTYYFWDQCMMQSCEKAFILRWDLLICQELCNTIIWDLFHNRRWNWRRVWRKWCIFYRKRRWYILYRKRRWCILYWLSMWVIFSGRELKERNGHYLLFFSYLWFRYIVRLIKEVFFIKGSIFGNENLYCSRVVKFVYLLGLRISNKHTF